MERDQIMAKQGYLPVMRAAKVTAHHPNVLYRLLDECEIEGSNIGRARFVKMKSLLDWLGEDFLEGLRGNPDFIAALKDVGIDC